ncbi:hypothetical protein ACX801_08065 [Arthrobacter bambusae]
MNNLSSSNYQKPAASAAEVSKIEEAPYSVTYSGNDEDITQMPIVGTLSLSDQAVSMKVSDKRVHYTDLAAQVDADGVLREDVKTFGGPRGSTDGWSPNIKRRFFLTVRQLDLTPIRNSPHPLAFAVAKFPKTVRTNREIGKKCLEKVAAALKHKLGGMLAYPMIWNFEVHWDGNLHINLLLALPVGMEHWLRTKWRTISGHEEAARAGDVLHVTRFRDHDENGNELSFEDKFYNAAAYMAGLGEMLGFIKAHQYEIPEDWAPPGVGSGRMWGARGLRRAKVATYPIQNIAQKQAIEGYMAVHCPERLTEYTDPETGEVTIFNDGAFSPTRRAGSIQCLAVTPDMHDAILDLLEMYAPQNLSENTDVVTAEIPPAPWEREDFDVDAFTTWLGEAEGPYPEPRGVLDDTEDIRELLALCGITAEDGVAAVNGADVLAPVGFSVEEEQRTDRGGRCARQQRRRRHGVSA